ncbi:hypothetical protein GGI24_000103 [Coemansia furcata]|nr:hypothetical protein GGI24_000103 [Coemansia furcata]
MQRSKLSQKVLAKPFKSPSRVPPTPKPASAEASTPAKRPAPESLPPAARKLDLSTPSKRPRIAQTSATKPRRLSARGQQAPRFVCRDEGTLALLRDKARLQRQVAEAKEEVALLERAATLREKNEAEVVDALIGKWQAACAAASDDLFALLKPMMEAQRVSDQLGCNPFVDDSAHRPNTDDDDIDVGYMLRRFGIDAGLFGE